MSEGRDAGLPQAGVDVAAWADKFYAATGRRPTVVASDVIDAHRLVPWVFPDPNPFPEFVLFPRLARLERKAKW